MGLIWWKGGHSSQQDVQKCVKRLFAISSKQLGIVMQIAIAPCRAAHKLLETWRRVSAEVLFPVFSKTMRTPSTSKMTKRLVQKLPTFRRLGQFALVVVRWDRGSGPTIRPRYTAASLRAVERKGKRLCNALDTVKKSRAKTAIQHAVAVAQRGQFARPLTRFLADLGQERQKFFTKAGQDIAFVAEIAVERGGGLPNKVGNPPHGDGFIAVTRKQLCAAARMRSRWYS